MSITIAVIIQSEGVKFVHQEATEFFSAQSVELESQRIHAKAIQHFCRLRTGLPLANIPIHLVKVADLMSSTARFGLSVSVESEKFVEGDAEKLKKDIEVVAPMLKERPAQCPLDFRESDRTQEETIALHKQIQETVGFLRDQHGGTRIPVPIKILTDSVTVATIDGLVPPKPDRPAASTRKEFDATIDKLVLRKTYQCVLKLRDPDETLIGNVESKDLLQKIFEFGINLIPAHFHVRFTEVDDKRIMDIVSVSAIAQSFAPLME